MDQSRFCLCPSVTYDIPMPDSLWELEHIMLGRGPSPRLKDVTLSILAGVTAVLGESGAGKTSLLNLLVQFEKPTRGRLTCHIQHESEQLAMYWSPHNHGLWPHLTAREHLEAVMNQPDDDRIVTLLNTFDLADRAAARPDELSQGQRARLSVGRCVAASPKVMVMDEPLIHVGDDVSPRYWRALREHLADAGGSLVFSTHDPRVVLAEAQRVICLDGGSVIYDGPVQPLYHAPADERLARRLGPCNWFEPPAAALWLNMNGDAPLCVRPERLRVIAVETGAMTVQSARFAGGTSEVTLVHQPTGDTRTFVHRPPGDDLKPGDCVKLEVIE